MFLLEENIIGCTKDMNKTLIFLKLRKYYEKDLFKAKNSLMKCLHIS